MPNIFGLPQPPPSLPWRCEGLYNFICEKEWSKSRTTREYMKLTGKTMITTIRGTVILKTDRNGGVEDVKNYKSFYANKYRKSQKRAYFKRLMKTEF